MEIYFFGFGRYCGKVFPLDLVDIAVKYSHNPLLLTRFERLHSQKMLLFYFIFSLSSIYIYLTLSK